MGLCKADALLIFINLLRGILVFEAVCETLYEELMNTLLDMVSEEMEETFIKGEMARFETGFGKKRRAKSGKKRRAKSGKNKGRTTKRRI